MHVGWISQDSHIPRTIIRDIKWLRPITPFDNTRDNSERDITDKHAIK